MRHANQWAKHILSDQGVLAVAHASLGLQNPEIELDAAFLEDGGPGAGICIQQSSDVMVMPSGISHAVMNLNTTLAWIRQFDGPHRLEL